MCEVIKENKIAVFGGLPQDEAYSIEMYNISHADTT